MQSPAYELEHVELLLVHTDYYILTNIRESSVYVDLVDAVLWCCRPRSLTLVLLWHFTGKGDVVEVRFICIYVGEMLIIR